MTRGLLECIFHLYDAPHDGRGNDINRQEQRDDRQVTASIWNPDHDESTADQQGNSTTDKIVEQRVSPRPFDHRK